MYDKSAIINHMMSFIDFTETKTFLDIGCGKGHLLKEIGNRVGHEAKLYGIDMVFSSIEFARLQTNDDTRYFYEECDIEEGLNFADNSLDVILCCNVLECIKDKQKLISEIHRVLCPGGKVIMSHFDWDTQVFNAYDKNLLRKVIQTYNDWQQPWMNACDPWIGRRLWGIFNEAKLFEGKIFVHVLMETEYKEGLKGYSVINEELSLLLENGLIEKNELDKLKSELECINQKGDYFYSVNMYTYFGGKIL